jgi:hypothetical protein
VYAVATSERTEINVKNRPCGYKLPENIDGMNTAADKSGMAAKVIYRTNNDAF